MADPVLPTRDMAVAYITHFIDDAFTGADRLIVLQDGTVALDQPVSAVTQDDALRILSAGPAETTDDPAGETIGRFSPNRVC